MFSISLQIALAAVLIERLTGYPKLVQDAVGHPVQWIGALIARLDEAMNLERDPFWLRRAKGVAALAILLAVVALATIPVSVWLRGEAWGWLAEAVLATSLIAQHSLKVHVRAVYDGLRSSLAEGRRAVSMIVGRDPNVLDEAGVSRAAIESLAESTSDGVVAPVMALAIGGLPGIALYKAINTADSMIGHKDARHLAFGWAAARLDDLVNLIPARLSGLLIAGAASLTSPRKGAEALTAMWEDARRHESPNAGWPEAATAGALGIRLGGPRAYEGEMVELPWFGSGRTDIDASDIRRALSLYGRTLTLGAALLALVALFW
jgi:adenosylcobinamide-phosphate synthase